MERILLLKILALALGVGCVVTFLIVLRLQQKPNRPASSKDSEIVNPMTLNPIIKESTSELPEVSFRTTLNAKLETTTTTSMDLKAIPGSSNLMYTKRESHSSELESEPVNKTLSPTFSSSNAKAQSENLAESVKLEDIEQITLIGESFTNSTNFDNNADDKPAPQGPKSALTKRRSGTGNTPELIKSAVSESSSKEPSFIHDLPPTTYKPGIHNIKQTSARNSKKLTSSVIPGAASLKSESELIKSSSQISGVEINPKSGSEDADADLTAESPHPEAKSQSDRQRVGPTSRPRSTAKSKSKPKLTISKNVALTQEDSNEVTVALSESEVSKSKQNADVGTDANLNSEESSAESAPETNLDPDISVTSFRISTNGGLTRVTPVSILDSKEFESKSNSSSDPDLEFYKLSYENARNADSAETITPVATERTLIYVAATSTLGSSTPLPPISKSSKNPDTSEPEILERKASGLQNSVPIKITNPSEKRTERGYIILPDPLPSINPPALPEVNVYRYQKLRPSPVQAPVTTTIHRFYIVPPIHYSTNTASPIHYSTNTASPIHYSTNTASPIHYTINTNTSPAFTPAADPKSFYHYQGKNNFHWLLENADGTTTEQRGYLKNTANDRLQVLEGLYSYYGDDGRIYATRYIYNDYSKPQPQSGYT